MDVAEPKASANRETGQSARCSLDSLPGGNHRHRRRRGAAFRSMSNDPRVGRALRRLSDTLADLHARHTARHRATGYGFVQADRIGYVDPVQWDAVASRGGFFLRREVLRVIEEHGPENILPRYAMIFHGDKPVAIIAAQIVTVTGDRLHRDAEMAKANPRAGLLRRVLAPAARAAGNRFCERMLVAGNLLSWGFDGIAFAAEEDPVVLWPAVAEALYRIRRAERLTGQSDFAMVKDLTSRQVGVEGLRQYSYRPLATEPNMVLTLNPRWKTYEDYVAALDAKYRRKVKDQAKKLTSAGCTVETLGSWADAGARLHDLYLAVQRNASVRLVTVRESFLAALAGVAKDDFRCTVIRRNGEIVGFVTSVRDGDTAVGYYIGFDRDAAAEGLPIYLRLLHATVADAIQWGCRRLSLGRTALEPKAGLGAKPEEMAVWVRHRVPAVNWLFRGLLGAVPHEEAPERNPFKMAESESTDSKN